MRGLSRRVLRMSAVIVAVVAGWAVTAVPAGATQMPVTSWAPTTSPGTYDFGTLPAGQTAVQTFTLSNAGGSATSALRITIGGAAAFTEAGDQCSGTSLGPRKTCQVTVDFDPGNPGETDQATLTATAQKAAATATLTLVGGRAKATPALATSPGPGGIVGITTVTDTATLTGGFQPTGTITFNLYPTADCSGPAVDAETVTVTGNGAYSTPTGFSPTAAGTYQWTAVYTGDDHNSPAASACGSEQATINPAAPTLTTSSATLVLSGSAVGDTATLAGGDQPTGTITFSLYPTGNCSGPPALTQTVTVAGDGTYRTGSFNPHPGSYQWTAAYSGDLNNDAVSTGCGSEPVTVSPCVVADTSSNQGFAALQGAVDAATSGDTLTIQGTCTGDTRVGKDLTLTGQPAGALAAPPFLNGNHTGTTLTIASGATVALNALNISGGTATGCCGGGIANSGTLTLNGVRVLDNTTAAGVGGGGIGNFGSLTLNSTEVVFNTTSDGGGAGIWSNGTVTLNGDSIVDGNSGATQGGGGIFNALGGTVVLNDTSSITDNSNGNGGGIYNDGTATLNGSSSISGNTATVDGGGIWSDGTLTLNDSSSVTGNTAGGNGGGILNAGALSGATAGTGGNVHGNTPNDIFPPTTPTLTTSSAPAVSVGATVTDSATLTGDNPTGTIIFNLYATADCSGSLVGTEAVTVSGNGTYTTPTGFTVAASGTYEWTAGYSGDANNTPTSTGCGSEPVTVTTCLVVDTAGNQTFAVLQEAVNAASAGDTLTVQGTCTGNTTVTKNLTFTGQPTGALPLPALDGNRDGQAVITIDQGASLTINSLTITDGATDDFGGGISNLGGGALTLTNVTVSGNTSGGEGGGISNLGGTLTLNNSIVTNNTSTSRSGGGGGGIENGGRLILNNSTVSHNSSTTAGGGILSLGATTLNGTATVSDNNGEQGGGLAVFAGSATLNDSSTVTGNTGTQGGGIDLSAATLTMTGGATISDNTSTVTPGGGVFNDGGTLVGVTAGTGGNVFGNHPDDVHAG